MAASARLLQLLLLVQLSGALAAATEQLESCTSGMKGDFNYKSCADFCQQGKKAHCKFCKCQGCEFCTAAAASTGGEVGASNTITATKTASSMAVHPASPTASNMGHSKHQSSLEQATDAAAAPITAESAVGGEDHSILLIFGGLVVVFFCITAGVVAAYRQAEENKRRSQLPQTDEQETHGLNSPSINKQDVARDTLQQYRVRTMCVCFLCLQYSAYALIRRYSTGILHEDWSSSSVLGSGEAIKFLISLYMIGSREDASAAPLTPVGAKLHWLLINSGKMAVPAFLYLVMNVLGFASLHRIDAGTFAVIQQSKIFFTALFLRIFLNRTLSQAKWCALCALVLAVLLISLEAHPEDIACPTLPAKARRMLSTASASGGMLEYSLGVIAVTLDSLLSGFATVYFEKVLKTTKLSVWDRNLQLAFYSMLIYVPWSIYDHPENPFHGWTRLTVLVSLLGALGGILVAMVIKYADGLAKNLSTASSIVITAAASHWLFEGPMTTPIIIGSLIVIVSGYNYQNVA